MLADSWYNNPFLHHADGYSSFICMYIPTYTSSYAEDTNPHNHCHECLNYHIQMLEINLKIHVKYCLKIHVKYCLNHPL
jgi:hypothetical protein